MDLLVTTLLVIMQSFHTTDHGNNVVSNAVFPYYESTGDNVVSNAVFPYYTDLLETMLMQSFHTTNLMETMLFKTVFPFYTTFFHV